MPRDPVHALQQCCSARQVENSLACHCKYTYEFLELHTVLKQPNTDAQQQCLGTPVHARCSSAALQGKLKTALLVTAIHL
jgi:hypothetical protein